MINSMGLLDTYFSVILIDAAEALPIGNKSSIEDEIAKTWEFKVLPKAQPRPTQGKPIH